MKVKVFQILMAACVLAGINSSTWATESVRYSETGYNHPQEEKRVGRTSTDGTKVPDLFSVP